MSSESQRAHKILNRINELASISELPGCIVRTYGTDAFIKGRDLLKKWMSLDGLGPVAIDHIGNIRCRLESKAPNAKTFVIASHIDTVVNAGKFDGPLGVLMGMDLIENLSHSGADLPFHLELVGFCDEEGCRFHSTYLGSKIIAGLFEKATLELKDERGISLKEAINGLGGNVNELSKDAIAQKDWLGYFEIHIEQGPVLYERNIPVAVVTAIAGQRRVEIGFKGETGHAGTVPMNMRKDALACAADFILTAEKFANDNKEQLVATIGKLQIANAASNVIPGEVIVSLDLRSASEEVLSKSYDALEKMTGEICKRRGITFTWKLIQQGKPVDCDGKLNELLAHSITATGHKVVELVSGAGHDAVPISRVSPVAMLFVRCFKGISHNPLEDVELGDIAEAIKVSDNFIQRLIQTNIR